MDFDQLVQATARADLARFVMDFATEGFGLLLMAAARMDSAQAAELAEIADFDCSLMVFATVDSACCHYLELAVLSPNLDCF